MTARLNPERRICAHPGCDAVLRSDNRVGLCHPHGGLARGAAYREAHRERLNVEGRAYYAANRASVLAKQAARHRANPEIHRERGLRYRYGITGERFQEMLEQQGHRCPVCAKPLAIGQAFVDHDHACCPGWKSCGECVRAILCSNCNSALGLMNDDPSTLRAAADYLEAFMATLAARGQQG